MADPAQDIGGTELGSAARKTADAAVGDAKAKVGAAVATLKDQASQVANDAKGSAASIAGEARQRVNQFVDQQKAVGADTISGVARAAQTAAGDLEQTSPQMARLVRSAADGVDRLAGDIRSRDLNDIVQTLSDFGRKQPVALFAGAVVAGFVLARFLKSEASAGGLPANVGGAGRA